MLRFLNEEGQPLLRIQRIEATTATLHDLVDEVEAAVARQDQSTTGLTRDREAVKAEAAERAEVLRLLVTTLTTDAVLRADLKEPVSKRLRSKDAELLRYLQEIVAGVGTLPPNDLTEAGYNPAVLTALKADVQQLQSTQGATRQVELSTEAATVQLADRLAETMRVLDEQLSPLVRAQALAQPALVEAFEKARRIQKTAARRQVRYRGLVAPGTIVRVLDRREAGLPTPTLGNRSGRGRVLRFFTAHTPDARPAEGQGVLVKPRTDRHLEDYAALGPDIDAPYLLVCLVGIDGEGHYVVD